MAENKHIVDIRKVRSLAQVARETGLTKQGLLWSLKTARITPYQIDTAAMVLTGPQITAFKKFRRQSKRRA